MGGIFGGGGGPSAEEREAQKKQEELNAKAEARADRERAEEQRRLAAQTRARRTGGTRSLLSPEREDAQRGLSTTLSGQE